MTVRREYRCNLCHDAIAQTGGGTFVGVGVTFTYPGIKFGMIRESENHLCSTCLNGIKAECAALDRMEEAKNG